MRKSRTPTARDVFDAAAMNGGFVLVSQKAYENLLMGFEILVANPTDVDPELNYLPLLVHGVEVRWTREGPPKNPILAELTKEGEH